MPITTQRSIRILIIDDHAIVRAGLRILIESQPGLKVVGEGGNRTDALAAAVREQPDLILFDPNLGGNIALDMLPDLLAAADGVRILILTGVRDPEVHRRAVSFGAMGLVLKEKPAEVLIQAIEKLHRGEVWLERSMIASVLGEMARPGGLNQGDPEDARIATLTAREREIITLIGEGRRNQQIAEHLFISETTVRHHLTSIFSMLGVSHRLELVIYAYRYGLAESPR